MRAATAVKSGHGKPAITGIDHLLVGVSDLEQARESWLRLGFTLSPRGRHVGWGTANYCVMFQNDYLELLGIIDPNQFTDELGQFLKSRQGLLSVAFASDDAEASADHLSAVGVNVDGPQELSRVLELPEGEAQPAFRLLHLPASATPGLRAFICHHLTPELVRRRAWCRHLNGAMAIQSVTAVVEDPSALAIPYGELFGFDRVRVSDGIVEVDSGHGTICFTTRAAARRAYPALRRSPDYPTPWLAAAKLTVADPTTTAVYLKRVHMAFEQDADGTIRVAPADATGVVVEFSRAPNRRR